MCSIFVYLYICIYTKYNKKRLIINVKVLINTMVFVCCNCVHILRYRTGTGKSIKLSPENVSIKIILIRYR